MIKLWGVPWDRHSSFQRGPAGAPAAIRRALTSEHGNPFAEDLRDVLQADRLCDVGDLRLSGGDEDPHDIEAGALRHIADGSKLITLGGDHAVTWPVFRAIAQRWPGCSIVHFDAHPDLYEDFGGDPFSHASPFARIMESGLAGGLLQVGIRASTPHQAEQQARYGVRAFGPEEVEAALAALPSGPVYVSIDLDGLDPAFAPGVNHYEPGGLSVREVLRVIRAIPGEIVGADVVELNPNRDRSDQTAQVAAKFVKELGSLM
ncbi:MAG: agmatinase [Caulobacteraceae bacterium]|nr:agmatinase [Caulobacteraceae bacterium]